MLSSRDYLSWSSLNLLEKSEEAWIRKYIYGEKTPVNRGMVFGKVMAESLENDELSGDIILDLVMSKIPKFEIRDKEFFSELKDGKKTYKILCKPDSMKADMTGFTEDKSGPWKNGIGWTKKKVDELGQITFYATGMFLKTGKIPSDIELVDVETQKDENGKISATGNLRIIKTSRTMSEILNMIVRMKKACRKIEVICERELL